MKRIKVMIISVIIFGLLAITGCTSTLTAEQQKQAEIYRKYPGINYGPLAGTVNYDKH